MEGMEIRRSITLSEQLAVMESFNLRDLLKVRDEDEVCPSSVIAACEKRESFAAGGAGGGRTLLDVIRGEQERNGVVVGRNSGNGINWKALKGRLRRAGAAWTASSSSVQLNPIAAPELLVSVRPNSVLPQVTTHSISVRISEPSRNNSTVTNSAAVVASTLPPEGHLPHRVDGEETTRTGGSSGLGGVAETQASATAAEEEEQPLRLSLMALLEQTDRQWGSGGEGLSPPPLLAAALLGEDDDLVEDETEDKGGIFYACCVCMVRHKGAAFIPCGHTFCRLCSREIWVNRGNCPICNGFILDILDIF